MSKKRTPVAKRPLSPDEMGRKGQSRFGELCDGAGLIANDSSRADRMGWDYMVEMPIGALRGAEPFDKRHKVPALMVQVKTIWADRNEVSLDLIAVERLARSEHPSFVVVLRMEPSKEYKDAYIIHLLDENLGHILKALRKAEAKKLMTIKKKTITFNINKGKKINVESEELVAALQRAIGNDGRGYTARKREQLENLGFDMTKIHGKFNLVTNNCEEMLDIFLGLQLGHVKDFEVDEVRFGIPIPVGRHEESSIQIKPDSKGRCQITISVKGHYRRVVFDADLYLAGFGGVNRSWKLHAKSGLVELIASSESEKGDYRIGLREDHKYTIDEHIKLMQAKRILTSGPSSVKICMQGKSLIEFDAPKYGEKKVLDYIKKMQNIMLEFKDILYEIDGIEMKFSEKELYENIEGVQFILEATRANNSIKVKVDNVECCESCSIIGVQEGIFASRIDFMGASIAFWTHMRVSVSGNEERAKIECDQVKLRDVSLIGRAESLEAWVARASVASGIDFVVQSEKVTNNVALAAPPVCGGAHGA